MKKHFNNLLSDHIIQQAYQLSHGSGDDYMFTPDAVIELCKVVCRDVMHDLSLQKALMEGVE